MLIFLYFFNCLSLFTQQMPFILFIFFFFGKQKMRAFMVVLCPRAGSRHLRKRLFRPCGGWTPLSVPTNKRPLPGIEPKPDKQDYKPLTSWANPTLYAFHSLPSQSGNAKKFFLHKLLCLSIFTQAL